MPQTVRAPARLRARATSRAEPVLASQKRAPSRPAAPRAARAASGAQWAPRAATLAPARQLTQKSFARHVDPNELIFGARLNLFAPDDKAAPGTTSDQPPAPHFHQSCSGRPAAPLARAHPGAQEPPPLRGARCETPPSTDS